MVVNTADVTMFFVADHQARLRTLSEKLAAQDPGTSSRPHRFARELLMRLATHRRSQSGDARRVQPRARTATP